MVAHISSISVVAVSMGIFDICYETDYLTIYCPMEKTRKRDFVLLSNEKQIVLKVCRTFWLKKMCQDVVWIFMNSMFLAQEDLMG